LISLKFKLDLKKAGCDNFTSRWYDADDCCTQYLTEWNRTRLQNGDKSDIKPSPEAKTR